MPRTSCPIDHRPSLRFDFALRDGAKRTVCLRHSLVHRPLMRTAVLTALVVGTILTAINQGNLIMAGDLADAMAWKIPLTYTVPYAVTTWGRAAVRPAPSRSSRGGARRGGMIAARRGA